MSVSKPTIAQIVKTVLSAFIGVQSGLNSKKAFESGSLSTYVIAGLIFTGLFVIAIIFIVSTII
jgi:hypothetical protein